MKQPEKQEPNSSKGTFVVNVQFRQNATWQGNILWMEENRKQNFRSVLEMIRLMDEALLESDEDEKPNSWDLAEMLQEAKSSRKKAAQSR